MVAKAPPEKVRARPALPDADLATPRLGADPDLDRCSPGLACPGLPDSTRDMPVLDRDRCSPGRLPVKLCRELLDRARVREFPEPERPIPGVVGELVVDAIDDFKLKKSDMSPLPDRVRCSCTRVPLEALTGVLNVAFAAAFFSGDTSVVVSNEAFDVSSLLDFVEVRRDLACLEVDPAMVNIIL